MNRYNPALRTHNGEKVYSIAKGHFSVQHVSRVLTESLGRFISPEMIYKMLRSGELPGFRKGIHWIILKKDAIALLERLMQHNPAVNI